MKTTHTKNTDIRYRWEVLADEPGEWPDYTKSWGSGQAMRPIRLRVNAASHNGSKVKLGSVTIYGPRINKSGLGAVINEQFFFTDKLPDWACKIVTELLDAL